MRRRSVLALIAGLFGAGICGVLALNRWTPPDTVSVLAWHQDWPEFGGWSGFDLSADGTQFYALSDGSAFATGTLTRVDGRLHSLSAQFHGFLALFDPKDPESRKPRDAEGLAVDAQGRAYASFERFARLLSVSDTGKPLGYVPDLPPELLKNKSNSGLEALAITDDGALLMIPERSGKRLKPFPVHRYHYGRWDIAAQLPRDPGWLMVGADMGPAGRLYTLERRFAWGGFASRVRRFDLSDATNSAETVYLSPLGRHGNLEGLAVWQDTAGLHLTMITDDNLQWFQRNEIVEVTLPPVAVIPLATATPLH